MTTSQRVTTAIYKAIDEVNAQLPHNQQLEKITDHPLAGEAGALDSLAFLNLLVVVERELETEFGVELRLTEDEEVLDANSPLSTVGALIEYVTDNISARV